MDFKKLKLKKAKVIELSTDVETLPLEQTDNVAGGVTTSRHYCRTLFLTEELCEG
jgi:hypothetical protein